MVLIQTTPDANFYEHYACGSPRNYQGYCDESIARLIDQQSQELDARKRLALVYEIQTKLEQAAVRPALDRRLDYFTVWPHVKNLVPHHSIYGWGRMQEVWRDKSDGASGACGGALACSTLTPR